MATSIRAHGKTLERTGIGLRLPHIAEVVATRPTVGWLEVHPENFIANPHATELLLDLARDYPISVHTVGVSIGSAHGVDERHLARLRAFLDRLDPALVSGHLAWSTAPGDFLNDLLPLPYDEATLNLVAGHLAHVQDRLGRPYIVENPSSYVAFTSSTMSEVEFLNALVDRTGCQLLCDVSNVYLSGHNMDYDPYDYIDQLPALAIAELHLGGFSSEDDEGAPDRTLLVDTHAAPITDPVWNLHAHAIRRFGARPTVVEWDNDLPALSTLVEEAARADRVRDLNREVQHAWFG